MNIICLLEAYLKLLLLSLSAEIEQLLGKQVRFNKVIGNFLAFYKIYFLTIFDYSNEYSLK